MVLKKSFQVILASLFVVTVTMLCIRVYLRWTIEYRYGEIVRVSPAELTLRTSRNENIQVLVDDQTRVVQGLEPFHGESLQDKTVIVVGSKSSDGKIDAKMIRVVKPGAK